MKKRLFSLTVAAALALTLTVPAFAEVAPGTDGSYSAKTEIDGSITVPTIKITMAGTPGVQVNPYGMEVTVGSDKIKDQIIGAPGYVTNESDVPVTVSASVSAVPTDATSKAVISPTAPTATTLTKSIYLWLQTGTATKADGTGDPTEWPAFDKAKNPVAATKGTAMKLATLDIGSTTPTILAYRLNGAATAAPTLPWTAADTIKVTVAFSFAIDKIAPTP